MKYIYYAIIILSTVSFSQENNLELLFQWSDETISGDNWVGNVYNEIWGFTHNDREFAVMGSTKGTHIFDVTDPVNSYLIESIDGGSTSPNVVHRDFHTFSGYLYAVADEEEESTLQIIDLSNLPKSVNTIYDSNDMITRSHNIFIDEENEMMYSCGGEINGSSNYLSLISLEDPENPTFLTEYNTHGYIHDIYVVNNIGYLNAGNNGFHIVDFSDINSPQTLGSLTDYPDKGYNHSGWLTQNGQTYAFADENHGYKIKICDVSNPSDISVLSTVLSEVEDTSIPHNLIIKDDLLYVSHYYDGLWIWDISNPSNPTYFASYDTYPLEGGDSYKGAWGVYPLLPSGNILVSDMQFGLFVFENPNNNNNNNNNLSIENILIHPNPATSSINIKTQSNNLKQFEIYNLLGESVYFKESNHYDLSINIENLNKGIYLLKVYTNNNTYTNNFIKQ